MKNHTAADVRGHNPTTDHEGVTGRTGGTDTDRRKAKNPTTRFVHWPNRTRAPPGSETKNQTFHRWIMVELLPSFSFRRTQRLRSHVHPVSPDPGEVFVTGALVTVIDRFGLSFRSGSTVGASSVPTFTKMGQRSDFGPRSRFFPSWTPDQQLLPCRPVTAPSIHPSLDPSTGQKYTHTELPWICQARRGSRPGRPRPGRRRA